MRQLLPVSRSEGSQNNIGGVDGLLLDRLWLKEFEFFLPTIRFSKGPILWECAGTGNGIGENTKNTHTKEAMIPQAASKKGIFFVDRIQQKLS